MHYKQTAFTHITQEGYNHPSFNSERDESCVTIRGFSANALHGTKFKSYMVGDLLDTVQMLDRALTKYMSNEALSRNKISRIDRINSYAYIRLNKEPE